MGPVLDALPQAPDAAARDLSAQDAEESERRARTPAALARGPQGWQILAAIRAELWPGAMNVYVGPANTQLQLLGRVEAPSAMGVLLHVLPAGRFGIWQEDAPLHLSLRGASLQSATRRQVLNGANLLAVESGGGWEFLQFRDALLTGEGEWRLSGLLRGQFGTDDCARSLIPAGARVVLIDAQAARLSLSESERGLELQWRVGPAGRDRFGPSYAAQAFAAGGRALRPWSPGHIRAARQTGGAIRISWLRRARWGGDSWEGRDPPLSEEAEMYQVSIFHSGVLMRRMETAAPEAIYNADAKTEDFGGLASALDLEVVQLSNRAGAGISRSGFIAVN